MGRVVYFDCAAGASGDMLLGALVDLGLSVDDLRKALRQIPLDGYRLEAGRTRRSGIDASKVDVVVDHAQHAHRGLREIRELLTRTALERTVTERALGLFERLAEAEAQVHGTTPEKVHFHEVGAVDSIIDIVGSVWGLEQLGANRFVASALNLGTGSITMSHGKFSVPPPATTKLVQGVPVYGDGEGELLTPTGALLVTSYAESYGCLPPMRIESTGCGAGGRELADRPNVLRLIVGQEDAVQGDADTVLVLECEIDDLTPELLAPLPDRLVGIGALDAYLTPVLMKKGRPGFLVTALVEVGKRLVVEEMLFSETTTLGIRGQEWQRTKLARGFVSVDTVFGAVRIKLGRRGDKIYNAQPEFEDCRRAAEERGVAVKQVWAAAVAAYQQEHAT
jgi:hypothetical protein